MEEADYVLLFITLCYVKAAKKGERNVQPLVLYSAICRGVCLNAFSTQLILYNL